MTAIAQESAERFRIRFAELARSRRGAPLQIDPYLIGQAIAHVMRACTVRSAAGRPLLWNEYRMFLARPDFELVRSLQAPLARDLTSVLAQEARSREAELVGELRVTVVIDEGDELAAGEAVVRVAFAPTERLAAVAAGELTVRFDARAAAAAIAASMPRTSSPIAATPAIETVFVADARPAEVAVCRLRWPGGEATLPVGAMVILGRPHPDAPAHLVPLTGASSRVNKQHLWIEVRGDAIRVGRFARSNPVAIDGEPLPPGGELEVPLPAEIALSHGDLVISAQRI